MPVLTGASAPGPLVLRGGGRAPADSGVRLEPPRPCTLCSGAPAPVAAAVPRLLTRCFLLILEEIKTQPAVFLHFFKVHSIPFMSEVAFLKAAFSLSSVLVPSAPWCPCSSLARHAEQQR